MMYSNALCSAPRLHTDHIGGHFALLTVVTTADVDPLRGGWSDGESASDDQDYDSDLGE